MKNLKSWGASLFAAFTVAAVTTPAHADEWGCTVLLCLANPSGPTAVSECVGPINKLWRHLASFHPFPVCDMEGAPGTGVNQDTDHFEKCPEGTAPLDLGALALQGPGVPPEGKEYGDKEGFFVGRGDTKGTEFLPRRGIDRSDKICVGDKVRDVTLNFYDGEGYSPISVGVYNTIIPLKWQTSPNVIDVYIEGRFHNRVRW